MIRINNPLFSSYYEIFCLKPDFPSLRFLSRSSTKYKNDDVSNQFNSKQEIPNKPKIRHPQGDATSEKIKQVGWAKLAQPNITVLNSVSYVVITQQGYVNNKLRKRKVSQIFISNNLDPKKAI